jgi:hypothetical protein
MNVDRADLDTLRAALNNAESFQVLRDEMNAAVHLAEARYSPVTAVVIAARERLDAILTDQADDPGAAVTLGDIDARVLLRWPGIASLFARAIRIVGAAFERVMAEEAENVAAHAFTAAGLRAMWTNLRTDAAGLTDDAALEHLGALLYALREPEPPPP